MREIKFRAWFKDIPHMATDIEIGHGYLQIIDAKNEEWNREIGEADAIMQYTGLKDKDGKDVYEGDIINWNGLNYAIEWERGAFRLKVKFWSLVRWVEVIHLLEVLGNVYQNPELLTFKPGRSK
jgi:uncharacterized phage protein (TIGR01671 family)